MSAIIELKNVSKSFGGITALKKASIKVDVGEVVGLSNKSNNLILGYI